MPELSIQRYDIAFLKDDRAAMDREAGRAQGQARRRRLASRLAQGFVSARIPASCDDGTNGVAARRRAGAAGDAAGTGALCCKSEPALWEALSGNVAAAQAERCGGRTGALERIATWNMARRSRSRCAGESSRARGARRTTWTRASPKIPSVRFMYLPAIRALLALNRDATFGRRIGTAETRGVRTISAFRCARPPGSSASLYPVYVARARPISPPIAAPKRPTEFQKILDHRAIVVSDPIGALARSAAGAGAGVVGRHRRPQAAYRDFLALWKDADADIPILKQAKAEYAGITRPSAHP